ncbi:MAG: MBL fold metallo-hydrolase [Dysgonamonadaceae bacterium]|jgi:glyoxylase-like metal-dependent hydrolase (beta-lactamase superfamily II)|nr:MBL fold metallo-hydrolase [Dysgonamonadaceae bacterium]
MQIYKFEFNQICENTYLIRDEANEAAIIDCGAFFPEEKMQLVRFMEKNQLHLIRLLNTHLHMDHTFGNGFIYETYNILPEYHRLEETMPNRKDQARSFGIIINEPDLQAANHIEDGDIVAVGTVEFRALLIPGHSPGSLCFYSEKDGCVFSGDVLFNGSIGRSDLWGGNMEQLISGIREKLLTLPDDTVVYPGHGPATTIENEKKNNPYLKIV